MTPTVTTSRRAAPMAPEQRRAAIIAATLPLVREHGRDITTRQIADAAGIAEGTIFRVFDDKHALIDAVVAAALDPADYLDEIRRIDLDQPLRARIHDAVDAQRRRLEGIFNLMFVLQMGPPFRRPDGTKDVRKAAHNDADVVAATTTVFAVDPSELVMSPVEAARRLRLVTFSATHPMIADHHPLTNDEIVDLFLYGVATDRARPSATRPTATRTARRRPSGRKDDPSC